MDCRRTTGKLMAALVKTQLLALWGVDAVQPNPSVAHLRAD